MYWLQTKCFLLSYLCWCNTFKHIAIIFCWVLPYIIFIFTFSLLLSQYFTLNFPEIFRKKSFYIVFLICTLLWAMWSLLMFRNSFFIICMHIIVSSVVCMFANQPVCIFKASEGSVKFCSLVFQSVQGALYCMISVAHLICYWFSLKCICVWGFLTPPQYGWKYWNSCIKTTNQYDSNLL